MKVFRPFMMFSLMLLFVACGEKKNSEENEVPMVAEEEFKNSETAIQEWEQAWNSNNAQQLLESTSPDAVLMLNGVEVPKDSIRGFLETSGAAMQNLQQQSLASGSSERMAYDTGTYTHNFRDDTTNFKGTYTFIWERAENEEEWKVTLMNISDVGAHAREPEMQ